MPDIKLLIAIHNKSRLPEDPIFLPVQAGRVNSPEKLNIQGDDDGENISEKNPNFCELTVLYWAWKNLKCDIIGLCHYRRYFNFRESILSYKNYYNYSFAETDKCLPDNDRILKQLSEYDILLARPNHYPYSLEIEYKANHISEDLEIVTKTLCRICPDYYETWLNILKHNNKLPHYNMFICRYELFNRYCEWLFTVLFELEKEIRLSPYIYQQRVFGFIAERLMLLYCIRNKLKTYYLPVIFLTEEKLPGNKMYLFKILLKDLSFYLGNPKTLINKVRSVFRKDKMTVIF
jgi:hypothetical protein